MHRATVCEYHHSRLMRPGRLHGGEVIRVPGLSQYQRIKPARLHAIEKSPLPRARQVYVKLCFRHARQSTGTSRALHNAGICVIIALRHVSRDMHTSARKANPMTDRAIATAADYADALLTARRAKNLLVLIVLLMLLIQLVVFFVVKYTGVVYPLSGDGVTSAAPATAPTTGP